MDGLLQCANCGENLDLARHRPKLIPCGHTLCSECVRSSARSRRHDVHDASFTCPTDKLVFRDVKPSDLEDDLQLLCWIEAASEGLLECVRCGCPFDGLYRRPAALSCGHTVCRVCLSLPEAPTPTPSPTPTRPRPRISSRRDSVDESWDYSQEDGAFASCSSMSSRSSLPSDSDGDEPHLQLDPLHHCPIDNCRKAVRVRDHYHLLGCLNGSPKRAKRPVMADKFLESDVLSAILGRNMDGVLPSGASVEARMVLADVSWPRAPRGQGAAGAAKLSEDELHSLLATLRCVVEHQDSPGSEQPAVLQQISAINTLPDLILDGKSQAPSSVGFNRDLCRGEDSLKESKLALDVWDLSLCGPGEMKVKKEALLRSDRKVWKLTGVDCWSDPEWTLRLLRRVAADVEQLQLRYATRDHLQLVRDAMPHLRHLELRGWRGADLLDDTFSFDGAPDRNRNTLEWLEVFLPMPSTLSLLRAHRRSLRKLRLLVADEWTLPKDQDPEAPDEGFGSDASDCEDGDGFVEGEDGFCVVPYAEDVLRSHCWEDLVREFESTSEDADEELPLSSLSLLWPSSRSHDIWHCRRFSRILRGARPHLNVDCDVCALYHRVDE